MFGIQKRQASTGRERSHIHLNFQDLQNDKHNAELQRADPGTKVTGNSVLGVVFSPTMPKMDFRYSHRFS